MEAFTNSTSTVDFFERFETYFLTSRANDHAIIPDSSLGAVLCEGGCKVEHLRDLELETWH